MRIPAKILFPVALLAAVPAFAQTPAPSDQAAPPARVGRVAFASGNVAIYQLGQTDWSKATINLPVASGDWFATDQDGRAELRLGPDSVDLANNTELNFADLREGVMQIALSQGRIDLHLRDLPKGESDEIDLPVGAVWLLQAGIYDVALGGQGQPGRISVFEGSARFVGGGVDKTINAGEALVLNGNGANLAANVEKATQDEFASWCRSRDYDQHKLAAPYHVSPRMTGYEELDRYGRWQSVGQYGEVWYPSSAPVGWVPYRDGYWDWAAPWGWTWVDAEPWGFAPFHYGRWAYIDGMWGWVPGGYVDTPVYAPALVGWIGDPNATLAAAFDGPAVGWFPLGPGEAYYPAYTGNQGYLRAVNAGAVINAATLAATTAAAQTQFANRRFATVVPQQSFASGATAARAALPVSDPAVQRAAVSNRPTAPQPALASAAATRAGVRNPGAPNFSRLSGPAGRSAQAGPPGAPNFAHLVPTLHAGHVGAAASGNGAGPAAAEAAHGNRAERLSAAAGAAAGAEAARIATPHGAARAAGRGFAGPRMAAAPHFGGRHAAGPRFAGPRAAGPHFAGSGRAAPHFAGPRMAAPRMAAPHFAGPRFAAPRMAAPHLAGAPGGGHGGGGGGPPGGGGPHAGGGGGPHGGGPHGGGGGGGGHGGGKH
ncbi:MAG TPA: DUF6600 domain-containing protein [Stellaceae bacterium]|nr:DUF6600 domain-containing protein [Stellaceae bacterium]